MVFSLFMFLSQNFADEGIGDVIPCYNDSQKRWETEADLGMFTMFGRTGAPTKMAAPHEDQKNVCNVPTHRNCPKVIEVINKIKILCEAPHFFLNRARFRVNPALLGSV